ncbi:hypothetical protein P872_01860 [Rhodonellum psychrophilum GCM71 = DSM 17998]|uniref:Uncharacterized protein n=1 Tax=Rhodonellum psychrophilum GCM71 = DSM 17998 TaxID=1123057 RepID=U5C1U2_9BACT|nr:hypothetical protein P872_01860 [Rhodonellum psychrophilum GCM71 = DSM 17998]
METRSIWFSRKKVAYLLENTDLEEGGIRLFLGQYDE